MAARTSVQSGNWSASATWGATPPTTGDTVTIGGGHAVVVDADVTVGTGSGTAIGVQPGNTTLEIAAGVTLTVNGDIHVGGYSQIVPRTMTVRLRAGANLQFQGGATLQMDPTWESGGVCALECLGTGSARCRIAGVQGSPAFITRTAQDFPVRASIAYTDFLDFGSTGARGIELRPDSGHGSIADCTFTRCSLYVYGSVTFARNTFSASPASPLAGDAVGCALFGSGPTSISHCSFDGIVFFQDLNAGTIDYCGFGGNFYKIGTSNAWTLMDHCFVDCPPGPVGTEPVGPVHSTYILKQTTQDNPHAWVNGSEYIDCILDCPRTASTGDDGDTFTAPDGPLTVKGLITLPVADGPDAGLAPCTGASFVGGPNAVATFEHCTFLGGGLKDGNNNYLKNQTGASISIGENYVGHVAMITSVRSNIWAGLDATKADILKVRKNGGPDLADVVTGSTCDYNAGYRTATSNKGYGVLFSASGTPGVHDVDGQDPQFKDPTVNIERWGAAHGVTGADFATRMVAARDYLMADITRIDSLLAFVRDGVTPQNPAYHAAHDTAYGGWIGAVDASSSGGGPAVETGPGIVPHPQYWPWESGTPDPSWNAADPFLSRDLKGLCFFRTGLSRTGNPVGPYGEFMKSILDLPCASYSANVIGAPYDNDANRHFSSEGINLSGMFGNENTLAIQCYRNDGFVYNVASSTDPLTSFIVDNTSWGGPAAPWDSDPGTYRVPTNATVANYPGGSPTQGLGGDSHFTVLQTDADGVPSALVECYCGYKDPSRSNAWHVASIGVFDPLNGGGGCRVATPLYTSNTDFDSNAPQSNAAFVCSPGQHRPNMSNVSDAGSLPVLPFLFRYDEVIAAQAIGPDEPLPHAIRMTFPNGIIQNCVIASWPCTSMGDYAAIYTYNKQSLIYGQRIRLNKAWWLANRANYPPFARTLLATLATYGGIQADGSNMWAVCGAIDSRWPWSTDLIYLRDGGTYSGHSLSRITGSLFEVMEPIPQFVLSSATTSIAYDAGTHTITPTTVSVNWAPNPACVGANYRSTAEFYMFGGSGGQPLMHSDAGTFTVNVSETIAQSGSLTVQPHSLNAIVYVEPLVIPIGAPIAIDSIADRSAPAGTPFTVTLTGTDPYNDTLTWTARADTFAGGLQAKYGFVGQPSNYYLNYTGRNEKWLYDSAVDDLKQYFILPNGEIYFWDGVRNQPAQGTLIGTLPTSCYNDPLTLINATTGGGPAAVSVTGNTLTVTPNVGTTGPFFVHVTASDAHSQSASESFQITATAPTPATGYTFTGPTSGTVGAASSAFTVTPNGTYTGTVTVTPSGAGLSTPIVLTWTGDAAAKTFTITPTQAGTVTLVPTNDHTLTNQPTRTYVATAPSPTATYLVLASAGGTILLQVAG